MIRIHKPREAPEVLLTRGRERRRVMASLYTRFSRDYNLGRKSFGKYLDAKIYGRPSVKKVLVEAQHGKCCFCESKVTHVAYGDVEHFRPKKGFRQQPGDPLGRPGYYWLAYEWSNLLFLCQLCNQRHKRNLFPLRDPSKRARSHRDKLAEEEPLFIHPAEEDPEQFVGFRREMAFPIDGNARGQATIASLGINRAALSERRRDYYERLRILHGIASLDVPEAASARVFLERAVREEFEYAAMARAAVAADFSV